MNYPSSFLFILLLVSFSHLLTHSSLAIRKFEDTGMTRAKASDIKVKVSTSFEEGGHVQRKHLHEVHSGPNPISNSFPRQKWKTRLRRSP
ncbi:hypothetical protein NC653_027754 [Populus alba x Populus x berolinensis]|uniref:Transmembrane protein n=2 Tax=Populus TaxID=3689 RepID=A0A8X8CJS9_POPTO|nr:hypothetical protein POTOM_039766 [Populus tomentosa]KAJ6979710.1 hypothetical protein NC653_027754 [Populus alba x Populus x berolinensis]